jgi:hypothetical protein
MNEMVNCNFGAAKRRRRSTAKKHRPSPQKSLSSLSRKYSALPMAINGNAEMAPNPDSAVPQGENISRIPLIPQNHMVFCKLSSERN